MGYFIINTSYFLPRHPSQVSPSTWQSLTGLRVKERVAASFQIPTTAILDSKAMTKESSFYAGMK